MPGPNAAPRAARAVLCLAALALGTAPAPGRTPENLALAAGARVGVVNLLDPEVTHFHAARQVQDSFLKTYTLDWPVAAMLMSALSEHLRQQGLSAVALEAGADLHRAREDCFLNASLVKSVPKECARLYAQLAGEQHVDALIVLGPGLNNGDHAGGARHRDLPEYLRGLCFVTGAGEVPSLLNLSELLLIGVSPKGAQLAARQWGGDGHGWTGYRAPADLKAIPAAQLEELKPLYAAMLKEQAEALLAHLTVVR